MLSRTALHIGGVIVAVALTAACASTSDVASTPTSPGSVPTPGSTPSAGCDAGRVAWAVGQRPSDQLLARARSEAGASVARFLRPGDVITLEFLASRLNLELDAQDLVRAVRCG